MAETRNSPIDDMQASAPAVQLGLTRAGVTGVQKAIRIRHEGHEKTFAAEISCTVDLDPGQKGVHMSRFPELFEEAIDTVVIGEAFLVEIVAQSMSSPVYELLKRPDELFVVEHAHLQPRFVEDSVRFALKAVLDRYPALDDEDFVFSRQLNLETIHRHDVLAERTGTVGELRNELAGA